MNKLKLLALLTILLLSKFANAQTQKEIGTQFITTLFQKEYTKAVDFFDESLKGKISDTLLEKTVAQISTQLGEYKENIEINQEDANEMSTIYYYSKFEKSNLDIKLTFNKQSKLLGFFFAPHKEFKKKATPKVKSKKVTEKK
jgi:hypothetical protein